MVDGKKRIQATPARDVGGQAKRQRVSRACDQCRVAREKCDGIQPICFTCASSNRTCSYTANPKKRGIQPGYIRTLEVTLAWAFLNVPDFEERIKSCLQDKVLQAVLTCKDTASSNKLHKRWRKSAVCKDIDRLLSGAGLRSFSPASDDEDDEEEDSHVATFDMLPVPDSQDAVLAEGAGAALSTRPVPENYHWTDTVSGSHMIFSEPLAPYAAPNKSLRLPENVWRLLDVYFAYTHCWMPIVEKEEVLKTVYAYPPEGLPMPSALNSGEHAVLWSVLAIASVQEQAANGDSSNTVGSIYHVARALVPFSWAKPALSHVQALVILAAINIGIQEPRTAWVLVGKALRLLPLLGDCSPTGKARVTLTAFWLETILSAQIKQAPNICTEDVRYLLPIVADELQEWHPWTGCDGFGIQQRISRSPVQSLSTVVNLTEILGHINTMISQQDRNSLVADDTHGLELAITSLSSMCAANPIHIEANPAPPHRLLHISSKCLIAAFGQGRHHLDLEDALRELGEFEATLGVAAVPPIVSSLLTIPLQRVQLESTVRASVEGEIAKLKQKWSIPDHPIMAQASNTAGGLLETPRRIQQPLFTPSFNLHSATASAWKNITSSPGFDVTQSTLQPKLTTSEPFPGTTATPIPSSIPLQPQVPLPANTIHHISRYTSHHDSTSSTTDFDFDALIDDLTSLDDNDPNTSSSGGRHDAQPQTQFMQNLGFAPGADLADVLMSADYGGGAAVFDPLLAAYLGGAGAAGPGEQRSDFDSG